MEKKLQQLEQIIEYFFKNKDFLFTSMMHPSFANEKGLDKDNQRMEFLGDSVLGLVITETLYQRYPFSAEGELSRLKSIIVSKDTLADLAKEINLNNFLLLGTGELNNGGDMRASNLADAFEALIGAVYLDGGFKEAKKVLDFLFYDVIADIEETGGHKNYKSKLQEISQDLYKTIPNYKVLDEKGPEHEKIFSIEVDIAGKIQGNGFGKSKKEAEQQAA
ncbi:ribonuclease III, partial [bacterium]|nr:ribonuclease III [bacterium]